jgi:hypothetical protein
MKQVDGVLKDIVYCSFCTSASAGEGENWKQVVSSEK